MAKAKQQSLPKRIADSQYKGAPRAILEDLFDDYYERRRQIYFMNFFRGIFLGFGTVIGGTIVVALLVWVLATLKYVPLLDGIVEAAQHSLQSSSQRK